MDSKTIPRDDNYTTGRPSLYTEDLAKRICHVVATHSLGLKKLCTMFEWMPDHTTIYAWRWERDKFSNMFTKAKLQQAELMAEDCIDIADDTSRDIITNKYGDDVCNSEFVNRSRLRVDTRKWVAAKLLPKMYGDAQRVEKLEDENASLKEEARVLRAELDAKHKKEY